MKPSPVLQHPVAALMASAAVFAAAASMPVRAADVTLEAYGQALHARADGVRGQQLFQRCAPCHGADGHGSGDSQAPVIAAQQFRVILWQLIAYGQDKRWDVRMQAMVRGHDALSGQDIVDVAAFASGLPPVSGGNVGSGEHVVHGGELFRQACARCHGADAEGDDLQRVPKLAGQSYGYLLRQLHDALEGRRPDFLPGNVHRRAALDRDDLEGVSDYLSRLPP